MVDMALSWPGPFEVVLLFLLLAVPAAVVLVLLRARGRPPRLPSAFPIVPTAELDGPGTYRVAGVDKHTRADRDLTLEAASRANAQVKAEMEGIIVTSVRKA